VIVGDFEPSEILPILANTLERWKSAKPYARIERPFQENIQPRRETVSTPDKANAVFLAGLSMPIKDDHPDYPALVAGNFILGGGGLSSRLADRLRQKGGLSYTAMSMFQANPLDTRADLMILAIYNPNNVEKVVTGVDEELVRLIRDGVTTAELDRATKGYIQQQSVQRTNDSALAAMLATDLFIGRTMQFQAELEQKIKALTPEIVNAALRKHVDPKRLSTITAGDFKKK
jgi:zinc protease